MAQRLNLRQAARTVGTVEDVQGDLVTITTPTAQRQELWTTDETRVWLARAGRRKDVHTGARVMLKTDPERPTVAVEVVVLPSRSKYGIPVVALAPNSLTYEGMGGHLVTVAIPKARIDTSSAGDLSDVAPGRKIFARVAVTEEGTLAGAYEIIVLPDDSLFGS